MTIGIKIDGGNSDAIKNTHLAAYEIMDRNDI